MGLPGVQRLAGAHEVHAGLGAHEPWEPLGAAGAGQDAQVHFRKPRLRTDDTKTCYITI